MLRYMALECFHSQPTELNRLLFRWILKMLSSIEDKTFKVLATDARKKAVGHLSVVQEIVIFLEVKVPSIVKQIVIREKSRSA